MGGFFKSIFGGGGSSGGGGGGGGGKAEATKKLFTPEMVSKATTDYTNRGTAKWNQIMSGMGAGGGTGGDIPGAIQGQAKTVGEKLAELTTGSGYGTDASANMDQILKGVEGGIGAKYPIF